MSLTQQDFIDDMEPFTGDLKIMVRDSHGNVVAVKGAKYERHPTRDENVIVLETQKANRGRRT